MTARYAASTRCGFWCCHSRLGMRRRLTCSRRSAATCFDSARSGPAYRSNSVNSARRVHRRSAVCVPARAGFRCASPGCATRYPQPSATQTKYSEGRSPHRPRLRVGGKVDLFLILFGKSARRGFPICVERSATYACGFLSFGSRIIRAFLFGSHNGERLACHPRVVDMWANRCSQPGRSTE